MTVADLIAALREMQPDLIVFRYCDWGIEDVSWASSTPETDDGNPCVILT